MGIMGGMKNTAKRGAVDRALTRVESASIRAWANSPHNRAIWIQIAAANIAAGSLDPVRLATDIVASALGM